MEEQIKNQKLKKVLKFIILGLVVVIIGIGIYVLTNPKFSGVVTIVKQKLFDNYCTSINKINFDNASNFEFLQYDNGLLCVGNPGITYYNTSCNMSWNIKKILTKPIVSSGGKYFILGEQSKSNVCLYKRNNLIWENEVDGEVQSVYVNKNGYSAIIYKNKTFKQIVKIFDNKGQEILVRYYPNNYAVLVKISNNNKYIIIGELNLSTNNITSNSGIRIISFDKDDASFFEEDSIIVDMKFLNNEEIVALYDSKIMVYNFTNSTERLVREFENSDLINILLTDDGSSVILKKIPNIPIAENQMGNIQFFNNKNQVVGGYNYIDKYSNASTYGKVLSVNSELYTAFINFSGRRISQFKTETPIKDIVLFNKGKLAAVIYLNEIEFIKVK